MHLRAFFFSLFLSSVLAAQTTRPIPSIDHILIVSIDGGRPDLLLRANCPTIRSLLANGSYTFWAKTTAVALTLPSHVSMMTGVIPVRHGIHWNEDLPLAKPYYPKVPTLFELAHKSHYTTALVTAKPKFDTLAKPGTLDWSFIPGDENPNATTQTMEQQTTKKTTASDNTVTARAIDIITQHHPNVMLLHFASTDVAGHAKGWGSAEQIAAFEHVDASLAKVLAVIDPAHTAILVTADHGGAGRTHGADDPRSRHIPWILTGPGIRKNLDLTSFPDLEVNTYDTFATACYLMAIPVDYKIDGKPVLEVLENRQLLSPR